MLRQLRAFRSSGEGLLALIVFIASVLGWGLREARPQDFKQTATLELPGGGPANELEITLDAGLILGRDTEQIAVTGTMDVGIEVLGGELVSLQVLGGRLHLADTTFALFGGSLEVRLEGVKGTPSTPGPIAVDPDGIFEGQEYQVVFDEGIIRAATVLYDLNEEPATAFGGVTGQISWAPVDIARNPMTYELSLEIPVFLQETVPVPLPRPFGQVDVDILAEGTILASGMITYQPPEFGCDTDGDNDVDSADLNTLIRNWTGALDGDGLLDRSSGDCDGDTDVDSADMTQLIAEFTSAQGGPGPAIAAASAAAVPEPTGSLAVLVGAILVARLSRAAHRSEVR